MAQKKVNIMADKEIQSKLQKVSDLIASDSIVMSKQAETIKQQKAIIDKQQSVIKHVRNELMEMKKQLLIEEARITPKDFRNHLQKYLTDLRAELLHINQRSEQKQRDNSNEPIQKTTKLVKNDNISGMLRTSLYMAAARSIESKRGGSDRLFFDEYAKLFAASFENAGTNFISLFADALTELNLKNSIQNQVTMDYLAMFVSFRTKWIDDSVYFALNVDKQRMRDNKTKGTIKQIVVMGAGCDTRSFRLSKLPKDLRMYYLDSQTVNAFRRSVFGCDNLGMCQHLEVDFDFFGNDYKDNEWMDKLTKAGFNSNKKTVWICEEILQYLEVSKSMKLLTNINLNSCDGSWLIGEAPNVINVQSKHMHDIWVNLGGQRVITGFDLPKEEVLDKFGFCANQQINILGTQSSNYRDRAPPSYVQYQMNTAPKKGDKVTRIQMFRGMKGNEEEKMNDDDNDIKSPL